MSPEPSRQTTPATLASPVSAAELIRVLEPALAAAAQSAAGGTATLLSLALDLATASVAPDRECEAADVVAWVERGTRTLVFAAGEVRAPDGSLIAAAAAVFAVTVAKIPSATRETVA